ncbi:hypothetical protein C8F01DRAFT_1180080 [Mycena amicta]|nr:hypothetical protein C8F01DRAFT_1180080 [Mycena amicta]
MRASLICQQLFVLTGMAGTNTAPALLLAPQNSQSTLTVASGVTLAFKFEGPGPHTLNLNLNVVAQHSRAQPTSPMPQRYHRNGQHRTLRRRPPYHTPVRPHPAPYGLYHTPARVKSGSSAIGSPLFEPYSQQEASPGASDRDIIESSVTEYDSDGTEVPPKLDLFQESGSRERGEGFVYLNGRPLGVVEVTADLEDATSGQNGV